jgi:tetratricopeptide (TPR) repeat protein
LELVPDLAAALTEVGEFRQADSLLGETVEAARAVGNERLEWTARLGRASAQIWMGGSQEQSADVAAQAVEALARLGDESGLARSWNLVALTRFWLGTTAAAEEAWRHAIEHARRAQRPREEAQALSWLLIGTWVGPTPVEDGVRRCQEILERSPTRQVEAMALLEQGPLLAMCGRFSEARELFHRGKEILEDLGLAILAAGASQERFDIEMLAGDPDVAEVELRRACEILEQLGEKGFLSTRAALLAHALCAQGRYDEAGAFIEVAAETGSEDDQSTQALWRSARAKVLARQGDVDEGLRLVREAVAIVAPTDWLNLRGDALLDLAEALDLAERPDEAAPVIAEALRLYEQKGNIVSAGKAHDLLAELREKTPSAT